MLLHPSKYPKYPKSLEIFDLKFVKYLDESKSLKT